MKIMSQAIMQKSKHELFFLPQGGRPRPLPSPRPTRPRPRPTRPRPRPRPSGQKNYFHIL